MKDYKVLTCFTPDVIGFQSENISAFLPDIMQKIVDNTEEVFIFLDNDRVGKENSAIIAEKWGLKQIFTPDECLPLNDPAGVRQKYGPKAITKILKINGVL